MAATVCEDVWHAARTLLQFVFCTFRIMGHSFLATVNFLKPYFPFFLSFSLFFFKLNLTEASTTVLT